MGTHELVAEVRPARARHGLRLAALDVPLQEGFRLGVVHLRHGRAPCGTEYPRVRLSTLEYPSASGTPRRSFEYPWDARGVPGSNTRFKRDSGLRNDAN